MVTFLPEKHQYQNPDTKEFYTSVSTLLEKYKKPFDSDFFSAIIAKREGTTKKAILERWDKGKNDACERGKTIHKAVEKFLKDDSYDIEDLQLIDEFKKVFCKDDYKVFHSERILWSDKFKVAGTSDLTADTVKHNCFDVLDLKTNKSFTFFNKYGEYMLKPLDHLQNCMLNGYGLQLSLYAYMYSMETGKKVRNISLLYWDDEKFTRIIIPYMFWDCQLLLKHHSS